MIHIGRFYLVAVLLVCTMVNAFAQQTTYCKIVADNKTLPSAATLLLNLPDSTIMKTELSDDNGMLSFSIPVNGQYLLKTIATGYATAYYAVEMTPDTIIIALQPEHKMLNTVTVSAQKKIIEYKADRTVFNVENSIASIGADAYDVIRKAPGVRISNNNITITGKSAVSVMVNDRLLRLSGAELEAMLRSMPADNIQKIEVITTPPARYDAEGNTGIINIVTKKVRKEGVNGSLTAAYNQRHKVSPTTRWLLNYNHNKWALYANANLNYLQFISDQNVITYYPGQRQEQQLAQDNSPFYKRLETGVEYKLSAQSTFGLSYLFGSTDRVTLQDYNVHIYALPANSEDSILYTKAKGTETARRNVLNLNYKWEIDSVGKKINVDANYFHRTSDEGRDFTTQTLLPRGTPISPAISNRTSGLQVIDIRSMNADIEWPVNNMILQAGVKAAFVQNESDNRFYTYSGSVYNIDPLRTNRFNYTENTQAAYISAKTSLGKWELQAGLRGENTQTQSISHTLNSIVDNDYFKLFPTAYLQYSPNDDHSIRANYSRRIDRPDYGSLNPFREYMTAKAYDEGNPFLQPSFSHNVELAYTWKSQYTIRFYTEHISQLYVRVSVVDSSEGSFYFTQANAGTAQNYGVNITAEVQPAQWWECTISLSGYNSVFASDYYDFHTKNIRQAISGDLNNNFILNKAKTLLSEAGISFNSNELDDFDIIYSRFNTWCGIKALLAEKRLTLALSANDIFRTDKWRSRNLSNGTYQFGYYDARMGSFTATWKFGSNRKEKRTRNIITDEMRRGG